MICSYCDNFFRPTLDQDRKVARGDRVYCSSRCGSKQATQGRVKHPDLAGLSPAEYSRWFNMKTKYGLTPASWRALFDEQGGCCAVCGEPLVTDQPNDDVAVDHCHTTNQVRGILHRKCNSFVGWVEKNVSLIGRVMKYAKLSHPA